LLPNELRRIGDGECGNRPDQGASLLYADWLHAPGAPTVLMYAHFDVRPPIRLDGMGLRRHLSRQNAQQQHLRAWA